MTIYWQLTLIDFFADIPDPGSLLPWRGARPGPRVHEPRGAGARGEEQPERQDRVR